MKHGNGLIVTLDGIYYEGVFTQDILTVIIYLNICYKIFFNRCNLLILTLSIKGSRSNGIRGRYTL